MISREQKNILAKKSIDLTGDLSRLMMKSKLFANVGRVRVKERVNNMKKTRAGNLLALVAGLGVAVSVQAQSDGSEVIYRNDAVPISGLFAPTDRSVEFGDEIAFDGENRRLSALKLEYYSSESTGTIVIRVRQNDGDVVDPENLPTTRKPGTIAYESEVISIGSRYNAIVIDEIPEPMILANRVTVSVQLSGLKPDQNVGPLLRNSPTIGQSADDIWVSDGAGDWALATIPGAPANFAVEIMAIPEPSTVLLSILGGAALLSLAVGSRHNY